MWIIAVCVSILVILVGVGSAVYTCFFAVWNCPADGCGDVPELACQDSVEFALVVAVGLPVILVGVGVYSWRKGRRPSVGAFPPPPP